MSTTSSRVRRRLLALLASLPALGACSVASTPRSRSASSQPGKEAAALAALAELADSSGARYLLLGEVHDNADGHALRLRLLQRLTSQTPRAIALEQFDASRQAALDAARATLDARPAPERIAAARGLAEAAGFDFEGWNWEFYRPVVALALERGLPLIAANLSRAEALARMRGGAGRGDDPRPAAWPASAEQAMARAIRDGHCGLLPERAVGPMVDAQIARDRTMAGALVSAHRRTGLSVVLLAGNEHVRTDIGVPLHLAARDPGAPLGVVRIDETRHAQSAPGEAKAQTSSIGAIREEGAPAGGFARHIDIAPVQRPDPCEALRTRAIGR